MKTILLLLLLSCNTLIAGEKQPKTLKFQTESKGKTIKEVFYVLKNDMSVKQGKYEKYFMENLIVTGNYVNNRKEGVWNYFSGNKLMMQHTYMNDKKQGETKFFYKNGAPKCSINFANGELNGKYVSYYENGKVYYECNYADGKKHGKEIRYYKNGNIAKTINYENGNIEGDFIEYFGNNKIHQHIIYKNGGPYNIAETNDSNGEKVDGGDLINGNGVLKTYYIGSESGLMLRTVNYYNEGKKNGKSETFYSNGQTASKGTYTDGEEDDDWVYYKEDGTTMNCSKQTVLSSDYVNPDLYQVVEEMPEFPGGQESLLKYLSKEVMYPAYARQNDIEGAVYVKFVVNKFGNVEQTEIVKGDIAPLSEEALRVVQNMPDWVPGFQRGLPVRVQYVVPLRFKLK